MNQIFFRKGGFSKKKNRLRLRFWNLHQWIPREKLYQNQLSPEDYKFVFPKHEFGYSVIIYRLCVRIRVVFGHLGVECSHEMLNKGRDFVLGLIPCQSLFKSPLQPLAFKGQFVAKGLERTKIFGSHPGGLAVSSAGRAFVQEFGSVADSALGFVHFWRMKQLHMNPTGNVVLPEIGGIARSRDAARPKPLPSGKGPDLSPHQVVEMILGRQRVVLEHDEHERQSQSVPLFVLTVEVGAISLFNRRRNQRAPNSNLFESTQTLRIDWTGSCFKYSIFYNAVPEDHNIPWFADRVEPRQPPDRPFGGLWWLRGRPCRSGVVIVWHNRTVWFGRGQARRRWNVRLDNFGQKLKYIKFDLENIQFREQKNPKNYFLVYDKNIRFDFADKLKIGDVRYKPLTKITIKVQLFWRLSYVTFLKNKPFMSNRRFKKGGRVAKSPFLAKIA